MTLETCDSRSHNSVNSFRYVEKMFWQYAKIKKALEEERNLLGFWRRSTFTGGAPSSHAFISDPTANNAIKRVEKILTVKINVGTAWEQTVQSPEDWLLVIEAVLYHFRLVPQSSVNEVLTRRYLLGENWAQTCKALKISRKKYYFLRSAGIQYACEYAAQLGLVYAL